jgi:hypothetical protein
MTMPPIADAQKAIMAQMPKLEVSMALCVESGPKGV